MQPTRWVVATAYGYEAAALISCGKIPTISSLQRRHRLLAYLVVGWLCWHFLWYEAPKSPEERMREQIRWSMDYIQRRYGER